LHSVIIIIIIIIIYIPTHIRQLNQGLNNISNKTKDFCIWISLAQYVFFIILYIMIIVVHHCLSTYERLLLIVRPHINISRYTVQYPMSIIWIK